jgi:PAS domain S-box-containing protein
VKPAVKITIVFAAVLLITSAVGIQSYRQVKRLNDANIWVVHTHEVSEKLEHVLSVLKDAETGQRGFLLTGEERYLEPYNPAMSEIQNDIDMVAGLTRDNPGQQKSILQLRRLAGDKLDELRETIKLRRDGGTDEALRVVRSDRGKKIMDQIRVLVSQMESRESELLDVRGRAAIEAARQSLLMVGFGTLLALTILAIVGIFAARTMKFADRSHETNDSGRDIPSVVIRYAFAAAVAGLSVMARMWLQRLGPMPLFITFFPGLVVVGSFAGGGPGILYTILAVVAVDYWFIPPLHHFSINSPNDAISLGIFGGCGLLLSIMGERLQRARRAEAVSVTQEKELALLNMGNVMVLDLDHRITRWSEGNRRLYGYDSEEAQGRLIFELLETHFSPPLEHIHSSLTEKNYWEGEVTRRTREGDQLSVAILWALRRDEKGKPLAILEVSTDLTQQKLAEEELRQQAEKLAQQNEELSGQSEELAQQAEELSEQNEELQIQSEEIQQLNTELGQREKILEALLDSARLPIGEEQVIGKICHIATEMIGQPAAAVVVCEQQGDEFKVLARAGIESGSIPIFWPVKGSFIEVVIQQDKVASLEDTSLRPDLNILSAHDHQRFAAVLSSPLHVGDRPIGAISIYSRKPQQWTVEQFRLIEWLAAQCSNTLEAIRFADEVYQHQKQKEFLADILEASSQAFGVGYPDGAMGMTNKAFEQLTGYSAEELQSIDWAKTLTPPEWLGMERQKLDELHRTGLAVRYEKEYIRKDGTRVPVELLVNIANDAEGKPSYYYTFVTDITQRKLADEQIRKLNEDLLIRNEQLEFSNKELESFIYSVSHDLRAPIRHIAGFADLLMQSISQKLDEKEKRYFSRIYGGAEKMSRLIEDLLNLSRISRQEIQRTEVNMSELASSVIHELRTSCPERNVKVDIAGGLTAFADRGLLEIVLSNLLQNAWKFTAKTRHGLIQLGTVKQDGKILYYVRDNGAGFDQKYAKKMFWPFHRLHSEDAFEGTGIGLAIVERIVRGHGGKVWAEGAEGKGATIYFSLN